MPQSRPDEVRPPQPEPERDFETRVSEIGTDPNAVFDKDLNPVDYPERKRPRPSDRSSEEPEQ
jgi:hypothetical protein